MSQPKILIQLDGDEHASVFDAVVAVDAEIDHLLQYHSVHAEQLASDRVNPVIPSDAIQRSLPAGSHPRLAGTNQ